jgi:hypothetical protein
MEATRTEPLAIDREEELTLIAELLEVEQARLLVGTRHTFHREYRDELRRRLDLVEQLLKRVSKSPAQKTSVP